MERTELLSWIDPAEAVESLDEVFYHFIKSEQYAGMQEAEKDKIVSHWKHLKNFLQTN